jgi:hypothetical protein
MPGGYEIVDFDELSPVACPCGQARRAFLEVPDFPATIHRFGRMRRIRRRW